MKFRRRWSCNDTEVQRDDQLTDPAETSSVTNGLQAEKDTYNRLLVEVDRIGLADGSTSKGVSLCKEDFRMEERGMIWVETFYLRSVGSTLVFICPPATWKSAVWHVVCEWFLASPQVAAH